MNLQQALAAGPAFGNARGFTFGRQNNSNNPVSNAIDKLTLLTETTSTTSGTLSDEKDRSCVVRSQVNAYVMGGMKDNTAPANTAEVERFVFATEVSSVLAATLDTAKRGMQEGGMNAAAKGYCPGGFAASDWVNVIEDMSFSGETSVAISATLSQIKTDFGAISSSAAGYTMGGNTNAGSTTVIDKLVYAAETCGSIAATLDAIKARTMGLDAATRGYAVASVEAPTVIENMIFADDTSVVISATMPIAGLSTSMGCQSIYLGRGWAMGGIIGATRQTSINRLVYAGETTSTIGAVLGTANSSCGSTESP